jgi:6,7-dimethyl-8-ribityllumazine synthase
MQHNKPPRTFSFNEPPHVMIVEARFYDDLADMLLAGAKAVLDRVGVTYEVATVPGALEIPAAITFALRALNYDPLRRRFDGYVALGTVIKGDTRHDEIVGDVSANSLYHLVTAHALALGNGILTVNERAQAVERADPAQMDKGGGAAEACLRMIELKQHFRLSSKRRWVAR